MLLQMAGSLFLMEEQVYLYLLIDICLLEGRYLSEIVVFFSLNAYSEVRLLGPVAANHKDAEWSGILRFLGSLLMGLFL